MRAVHADSDATVDDDDLAGVDVVQEHNTNSTHADTDDTGTEDDSQDDDGQEDDDEDDPDNDAGADYCKKSSCFCCSRLQS